MKRGVSPVIATVLLIAITIVLAAIIFLWARSFLAEGAQKQGRAVELSCEELIFSASLVNVEGSTMIDIINEGNVPIYGFVFKDIEAGSITPYELEGSGLAPGVSNSFPMPAGAQNARSGLIVPVLLAEEDSGNRVTYPCPDVNAKRVDLA